MTTSSGAEHPGLTIRIYRVDPETSRRTEVRSVSLRPVEVVPITGVFPPCACPRCLPRTKPSPDQGEPQ